jgi:thiol peroxidase
MASVTLRGKPLQTIGTLPKIGTHAPDFTLTNVELADIPLREFHGKKLVLNIFPSLDTPTCNLAMKHFNKLAIQFPNILVLCISADLPFAQKRFCGAENLSKVLPFSTFRHPDFGRHYGVTLTTGPLAGLLSRAVLVIDENGKVVYTQQVNEISEEPDYSAVLAALK